MQTLRQARFLARLVLAWFLLSLGVAIASPLLKPVNFEVVCASTGTGAMKLVAKGETGEQPGPTVFDCPMCAGPSAPPPQSHAAHSFAVPLAHVLQAIPAARIAALTTAPLPARGPPAPSLA
jgi:hypothetical protein